MFGPCSHCCLCFVVSKGSALPAPWDTTHLPPSPQTANQLLVTSLPPLPLPQRLHLSAGATLTWTAFLTNLNHWDAPPETRLEVIDHLKEAVEVNQFIKKYIDLPKYFCSFLFYDVYNIYNQVEAAQQHPLNSNDVLLTPQHNPSFFSTLKKVSRHMVERKC